MKFKEIIKIIRTYWWYFIRQTGSHQQFHHKLKEVNVTVAGKPNDDVHPKTLKSIFKQAKIEK